MEGAPTGGDGSSARLRRCIRDLVALQALPSMCVGRTPAEALEIVLDAVSAALGSDVLHLRVPGSPPTEHAVLRNAVQPEDVAMAIGAVAARLEAAGAGPAPVQVPGVGEVVAMTAGFSGPAGAGRIFVGHRDAADVETSIVLVRAAANLVSTTLESARVLEIARRKDEFLAELGHELRNPLAPIVTAVELLAREPSVAREQRVLERHTRHLARLVDDLLDISRVTRGTLDLKREPVHLGATLERAAEIAGTLIARKGQKLEVDPAHDLSIAGDPVRLVQVFGNLLTNAAKFTPAGGHIRVGVGRRGDRAQVVVRDDGKGISRDQLQRIFEPFVQADREALSGGLGLGLAIVKNLVTRHGGTITAESEGPGRGSTFCVDLPLMVDLTPALEARQPQAPPPREGVRVLVVDDNVDVAELLSEALSYEGFATAVAHDAPGALAVGRAFSPHAAVLDLGLPEVDGYELARAMRAEHGEAMTLIAATGYGQARDRARVAAAGFACHLVKPVSVLDLAAAIDTHVSMRRAAAG
jgi:signal transduction histidine kinase/CheY-like chemotaxis protein